jgi:hypothetical protein
MINRQLNNADEILKNRINQVSDMLDDKINKINMIICK